MRQEVSCIHALWGRAVCVCCVTASGSLGCFQPPECRHSVLSSRYGIFLLSIDPTEQQSHPLCSGLRHVRERVRLCACLFVCRACVLIAHSLAKSPPPQVGQLRNGSWNRHGNNSSGQASECRTIGDSQTERCVSSSKHRLSENSVQSMNQVL